MAIAAKMARFGYRIFGGILPPITWREIEIAVRRSFIGVHPRVYGYIHYVTMLLGVIASLPLAFITFSYGSTMLAILLVITGAMLGVMTSVIYPYLRANSLASNIDSRLVSAVGYMALLAVAGKRMDEIFLRLAQVEGRDKPLTRVLLRFVRDVKILGMDYESAVRDIVVSSPSHRLAILIASMYEAIETTGSPADYLLSEFRSLVTEKRARLTKSLSSIAHLAEAFIILVMLGPSIAMLTVLLGGAMGIGFAGMSPESLMAFMVVGVIPFATAGMLIFLDMVLSEAETV
ncbi:Type II secretion system F protein [Pyrolobus fumarii 1A]|uniref:Type II secretion system F protein n=1 Tax=Pyrolobus fumarii (strain DSM 11204 / 1A) TaxID=694429 RepID=G0EC99_PYRF1|nr:type II secretion system F family protein [Pyrolobus fumarii]AEM39469.1 Type II secretion system F protein [Pyrolobus fumarii 1A]